MPILMRTKRQKQVVTLTLDPDVVERLKAWIANQNLPPPQNSVVQRAIVNFLDENERNPEKRSVPKGRAGSEEA